MISPRALTAGEPDEPPMVSVETAMSITAFGSIRSLAANSLGATLNGSAPVARSHRPAKVVKAPNRWPGTSEPSTLP